MINLKKKPFVNLKKKPVVTKAELEQQLAYYENLKYNGKTVKDRYVGFQISKHISNQLELLRSI